MNIPEAVEETLAATPFIDVHTHLFAPEFGDLALWGIDELLTWHYLEAELFRFSSISPAQYQALDKQQKADLIWQTLFVENSPLSEATRGIIAVLDALGLDTTPTTLRPLRQFFREQDLAHYIPRVFRLAGIDSVVMTNDPLDPAEASYWDGDLDRDPLFHAALRLYRIVNEWNSSHGEIAAQKVCIRLRLWSNPRLFGGERDAAGSRMSLKVRLQNWRTGPTGKFLHWRETAPFALVPDANYCDFHTSMASTCDKRGKLSGWIT